ncbi:MAG TPA: ATP-binding cassette domain-containing protein [Bryobacteraceae bacterium]|nr:ATP-binding cassette domain-containing protein [Bryobacteraceae bacterium]HOQ47244.1 ATP-binding cassette domain-containing protein [Bryobacteraceae bacterium]HPU74283.1 ATP-binding cassette domain-containing protein [Bryobacteraceae bacterium]
MVAAVRNLSKSFSGRPAVCDLSFTVEKGEVFGLLGPNGAGKTTTLRLVLGLLEPTSGSASVFGTPAVQLTREQKQKRAAVWTLTACMTN